MDLTQQATTPLLYSALPDRGLDGHVTQQALSSRIIQIFAENVRKPPHYAKIIFYKSNRDFEQNAVA